MYDDGQCKKGNHLRTPFDSCFLTYSNAKAVSFVWTHYTISSSDSKVRTTLNVSITDSGSGRDKKIVSSLCFSSMTVKAVVVPEGENLISSQKGCF